MWASYALQIPTLKKKQRLKKRLLRRRLVLPNGATGWSLKKAKRLKKRQLDDRRTVATDAAAELSETSCVPENPSPESGDRPKNRRSAGGDRSASGRLICLTFPSRAAARIFRKSAEHRVYYSFYVIEDFPFLENCLRTLLIRLYVANGV